MTTLYVRARSGVHVLITPSTTVRDARISYRASGVLSRLLDNAEGYGMSAEDLAAERPGGEGRDAIRTALRELRKAGYIHKRAKMGAKGRFTGWETLVYDTPQPTNDGTPEKPPAGSPPAGKPSYKSSKNTTKVTTSKAEASRARDTASAAADESRRQQRRATNKVRHVFPNGVICWVDPGSGLDDRPDAEALAENASTAEVSAGVAAVVATGKDPVPGLVWREIHRGRAAVEKAERAKVREAEGALAKDRQRRADNERRYAEPAAQQALDNAVREAREIAAALGFSGTAAVTS